MTRSPRFLPLCFVLSVAAAGAVPSLASAQEDATTTTSPASEPATTSHAPLTDRPFFVGAGLGLMHGFYGGLSFRLVEHVGYRFVGFELGESFSLALWAALGMGQSFGDYGFFGLNFDGVFGADLQVWDGGDLQLVVTPMLGLGAAVVGVSNGADGTNTSGGFHIQFAAQAELVMVDGLLGVWLRPLTFDGFVRDGGFGAYSFLAGVTFHL